MKLLTHNMLTSKNIKTVTTGYPLIIQARDVKVMEVDFRAEFISRIIPKIDWECLCRAAQDLGHLNDLPKEVPDNYENDEDFLKKAHHVMLEVILFFKKKITLKVLSFILTEYIVFQHVCFRWRSLMVI